MTARTGIPSFKGGFKSFSIAISTNREKGTESRLLVLSQGSRAKIVNYLWLKFLWDELSRDEMELFLHLKEILDSDIPFAALRAVMIVGKKKVREVLNTTPLISEDKRPSRERYLGYKRLDVEIQRIERRLPKVPKFSGWIRSSSAVGSKSSRGSSFLDPLAIIENDYTDIKFDWYSYLTVGEAFRSPVDDKSPR